jgi:hypothetical protein
MIFFRFNRNKVETGQTSSLPVNICNLALNDSCIQESPVSDAQAFVGLVLDSFASGSRR